MGANVIAIGVGAIGHCSKNLGGCKCCCQDRVLAGENYILVDSSSSSHVGPTIHVIPYCGCLMEKNKTNSSSYESENQTASPSAKNKVTPAAHAVVSEIQREPKCLKDTCLNGGRCLPDSGKPLRCICPSYTVGSRCKIVHREFSIKRHPSSSESLGSWAWLPPLPTCSHLHITIHLLTQNPQGLVLFSSDSSRASYNPFIALQIANGRPQLILRLGTSGATSTMTLNTTLNDYKWHRLDILWRNRVSVPEVHLN